MKNARHLTPTVLILGLTLSACGGEDTDTTKPDGPAEAAAPALGKADGRDKADTACQVILRQVGRVDNGSGGYETIGRAERWIWTGQIDVAKTTLSRSAYVGIIYRSSVDHIDRWLTVQARRTGEGDSTFERYGFTIDDMVPGPGFPGSTLARSEIEVIPYIVDEYGTRLFDHNRNTHPYANYTLTVDNGWSVGHDASVCVAGLSDPLPATVTIDEDGARQDGALTAGGTLFVDYDIKRMDGCYATHNGYPFWDTRAHVRFLPGGETFDATVRQFRSYHGTPTNEVGPVTAEFAIPQKATGVEIWFRHFSNAYSVCEEFDSNGGDNYVFDVLGKPQWIGAPTLKIERGDLHPCDGGKEMGDEPFVFESWARQRAAVTNICFEVYEPGVTDRDNPGMWQQLDVAVHYRYGSEGPFDRVSLNLVDQPGNNARYAWNIRDLDPFRPGNCSLEDLLTDEGSHQALGVEYFFTVNGAEVLTSDGEALRGMYQGYWSYQCQ